MITDFTPAGTAQALVEAEDPVDVAIALASSNPISKGTLEILKKARGLYKQGKVKEADELLAEAGGRSAKTTRAVASSVGKPTVELFGGQKAQTPGAINVDIRPDIQSGVRADATKLPFRDNSLGEVVASNPFIPKTVGGTNSMMDFLPEATRVVEPGGKIFINANAANPYGKIPSASELESLGLRVIQSGPLDSRFSGQKFLRTDGSVITNLDSMKTVVLEKIK